jgi:ATP-dependent helicase YprA (DUF1998 family)
MQMLNEELIELLEAGPVRCLVDGVLKQYTRNIDTADTCDCLQGEKACGFVDKTEWRNMLVSLDTDERISVWEMQSNLYFTVTPDEIDLIIGHGIDEPEKVSSCCSKTE